VAGRDAAGVTVLAARVLAARFVRTAGAACSACSAGFAVFAARFVGVRIAAAVLAAVWRIAAAAAVLAAVWRISAATAILAAVWRISAAAAVRVWRAGARFAVRTSAAAAGRPTLTCGALLARCAQLARCAVLARSTVPTRGPAGASRRFVAGSGVSARGDLDGQRRRPAAPAAQCP
jgi:hypothetical protein